jgi:hypothetical protein
LPALVDRGRPAAVGDPLQRVDLGVPGRSGRDPFAGDHVVGRHRALRAVLAADHHPVVVDRHQHAEQIGHRAPGQAMAHHHPVADVTLL